MPPNGSPEKKKPAPTTKAGSREQGTYFLGRYRVVDEIGTGGMASVHLARMDGPGGFQKWVAIKRIHPHLVEDKTFVDMFLDEARIVARINHPNVATVFELGRESDTYWIAMEYLHGEPLREVMRKMDDEGRPMPPEIACRVIADAAEGLHAAHELLGKQGERLELVHRDVTPHNLFITYEGATKVVDFGIAKFSSRVANTRAGMLKGKIAYMSPEQVSGEPLDRRTDLFALGVVLWELTTGKRLFRVDSDLDTLAKVQECKVPLPSSVVRGYPADLERIVMKALARNRSERYRTAREMSRALQSLLMRRGVFVASDEVAAYVRALFQDRIEKRDAHLRWAAEVTQTIFVEDRPELPSSFRSHDDELSSSHTSEVPVPSLTIGKAPRPAAGAPPLDLAITSSNPTARAIPRPLGPPSPTSADAFAIPVAFTGDDNADAADTIVGDRMDSLALMLRAKVEPLPALPPPPRPVARLAAPPLPPAALPARRPASVKPERPAPAAAVRAPVPQAPWLEAGEDDSEDNAPTQVAQPIPRQILSLRSRAGSADRTEPPETVRPQIRPDSRSDTTRSRLRDPRAALRKSVIAAVLGAVVCIVIAYAIWAFRAPGASPAAAAAAPGTGPFGKVRSAFAETLVPPVRPPPPPPAPKEVPVATTPESLPSSPAETSAPAAPAQRAPARAAPQPTGYLTVVCLPSCDAVYVNGINDGASPLLKKRLPTGKQRVRLVWSSPAQSKSLDTLVVVDQTTLVREPRP